MTLLEPSKVSAPFCAHISGVNISFTDRVGEPIRTSGHIEPSHFDMWDVDARVRMLDGSTRVRYCTQEVRRILLSTRHLDCELFVSTSRTLPDLLI